MLVTYILLGVKLQDVFVQLKMYVTLSLQTFLRSTYEKCINCDKINEHFLNWSLVRLCVPASVRPTVMSKSTAYL